ncbi:furin-1-like [Notothenia coriiceps]|uniref:Furin-1-like n=1 Tax=Notothenia coriiceps TaxID=8208 RepID=A0A6I9NID0_9TELE|nr:PREDICTED: furin-1-like [Notothenia coriiceps]
MSEDNIIFLNDLLLPHVGAISTFSRPRIQYGFGLLDAGLMVQQTTLFNTVSPQRKCIKDVTLHPTRILSPGGVVSVDIESDACRGRKNEVNTVEHVQVRVSISAVCRGDLSISLASPAGTVSLLLDRRPNDASTAGLKNWTLMTVHCWGEQPQGLWTFQAQYVAETGRKHCGAEPHNDSAAHYRRAETSHCDARSTN